MGKIKRILAVFLLVMMIFIEIPISVKAADSSGSMSTDMETNSELFITLEENTEYRWNVDSVAEKGNDVHLDTGEGTNCRFRLDKIENGWYGIKHIKVNGTDRFVDVENESTSSGAKLHLWESSDSKVKGKEHRQFAFYYLGDDANGNKRYYIKNRKSGKWIGYEGKLNNNNPNIIQTEEKDRKVWIVTKSVVPLTGKETQVLTEGDTSAVCEIYRAGELGAINRQSNISLPGEWVYFQKMGIASKWKLVWYPEYHAYRIEAISDGEGDTGYAIDIMGESGRNNTPVIVWNKEGFDRNQNTSQLWRFFRQNDGTYKIQNARNGMYINGQNYNDVLLNHTASLIDLSILEGSNSETQYNYADEWMAEIPDDALLSSVNIPATHDSGTAAVFQDALPYISMTSCQNLYYSEQLNVGARSFDIRGNAKKDDASAQDVMIIHGGDKIQCEDKYGNDLTLKDIFETSLGFLQKHPSETIILTVKPDDGSVVGLEHAVAEFIKNNAEHVYTGGNIPSMKEARGKIVFMRRFELSQSYSEDWLVRAMGLNITNWDEVSYRDYKYAYKRYDDGINHVYIQDAYNTYEGLLASVKWDYILGTMQQTTEQDKSHPIDYNSWVFNYTSCARGFPLELTKEINPRLFEDKDNCIDSRYLGMMMLNFIDEPMSRLIYETNFGMKFEPKLPIPEIEVEYGQTLAEATLKGIEGAPAGKWLFKEADHVVTDEEVANQTKFELIFQPTDNKTYKNVTMQVTVKTVKKTEVITAYIGCEEISYGEIPKMAYTVVPAETIKAEELETLFANVTNEMKVQETGQSLNEVIDAGTYKIDCPETVGGFKVKWIHLKEHDLVVNPVIVTASESTEVENSSVTENTAETGSVEGNIAENSSVVSTAEESSAVAGSVAGSNVQRIVVRADKKAKVYGEKLTAADLTFTISASEEAKLLPGDTMESLGLTLKATIIEPENILSGSTTDKDGDEILDIYGDAGKYLIQKDNATNTNYDVVVIPAFLNVSPKEADLAWNAEAQYTYTGNVCGIEARVKSDSLLENDSCAIKKLLNTECTEVGKYKAVAIGVTNANYILSGTSGIYVWEYEILQADSSVTFPDITVTYGDSLKKASLSGQSGEGEFRFADDTVILTVAENQSGHEMIFTPSNPNYKTVTSMLPVTVHPRKLVIRPDRAEKEYGKIISEYTWSIIEGNLAGEDQTEDLDIEVTLTAGDGEKENCKVGSYNIVEKTPLTAGNVNYAVSFTSGTLRIQPKPLGVTWNTDGTVVYTGKEANVSAEFTGVLFKDDCKAVVEGGNAVKPGKYTANIVRMTGEQSDNYVLQGEDSEYQIEYQIVKKEEMKQQDTKKTDTKGTTTGKTVKKVKTGDTFSWIWIVTMVGALVVIGVVGYFIKRKRK